MSVSTITAEGGTIRLSTASDGSVSASSGDFAVAVVQQVEITGGVVAYPSVAALVTASEGALSPGHYSAAVPTTHPDFPNVLTYWDGTNFLPRDLSPIEDLWNDIAFWVDQSGYFSSDINRAEVVNTAGDTVRSWSPKFGKLPIPAGTGGTVNAAMSGSYNASSFLSVPDTASNKLDVLGYFEVFSSIKLSSGSLSNVGVCGKWAGGGWLLMAASSVSPFQPFFGFNGVFAGGSGRIDTDAHVLSGRYTSDGNVYVTLDGVDLGSAVRGTGQTLNNAAEFTIGSYDATGVTNLQSPVGCVLKINRELTTDERAMVVAAIAKRSGITL